MKTYKIFRNGNLVNEFNTLEEAHSKIDKLKTLHKQGTFTLVYPNGLSVKYFTEQ
jgi:hypothetical protein